MMLVLRNAGNRRLGIHYPERGFTLLELLVVIAIISLLASLAMPGLAMAKEKARSIVCVSNLKQINLAITLYADSNNDVLVPAEFNVKRGAPFQEGWPTLLHNSRFLTAPTSTDYNKPPTQKSVYRCPSGLPEVYTLPPTSRDDPEGARARPYTSEGTGTKFYVHTWYGINGSTGRPERWPFVRTPTDRNVPQLNKLSAVAPFASEMPALFDGFWMHNGKDERINARHNKRSRTNLSFFDGHVAGYDTLRLPSVKNTNSASVRWRF